MPPISLRLHGPSGLARISPPRGVATLVGPVVRRAFPGDFSISLLCMDSRRRFAAERAAVFSRAQTISLAGDAGRTGAIRRSALAVLIEVGLGRKL